MDWFGTSFILLKVNTHPFSFGNIEISVIFVTPIKKVFNVLVVYYICMMQSAGLACLASCDLTARNHYHFLFEVS